MFRAYLASLRLAGGLISVGAGLIVGCQWLGLIPAAISTRGGGVPAWTQQPVFHILVVFISVGLLSYTLFIARFLRLFDSVQVVPDRVRQALDALAEGLLVLDEREMIVLANRSFAQTVGITAQKLTGRAAASLSWVTDDRARADDFPWRRARDANQLQSEQLMRYRVNENVQRIFSINAAPIRSSSGGNRGTLVTLRDVTQLEGNHSELKAMLAMIKESRDEISKKNRELEVLATQDALTGCYNRRAFFERFDEAFRFSKAHDAALSCVMVDNDHFKNVNDTYGHHVGDEVLRRVGAILRRLHTDAHAACRFGGEEFCVMLPGYPLSDAAEAAERIRREISAIRLPGLAALRLSVSIGVSDMTFGASEPQALINQADACLYVAKRAGRNRVVIYDPSMSEAAAKHSANAMDDKPLAAQPKTQEPVAATCPAVRSLVSALAFRDADTAEHSRRVADHCVRMAQGLLDSEDLATLEVAALLHDIGKIGIPDHILLKPEGLTDHEWKLMSLHDQIGVEIVGNLFACPKLLSIIRFHHCFFGGRSRSASCPVGREIPIEARILAIADSYDAMVADRVYRKGCTHGDAVIELRRCCHSQFDPELVERFIATFESHVQQPLLGSVSSLQVQAVHLGKQIDRLVAAVAAEDPMCVRSLTGRVRSIASARNLVEVVCAADRLETSLETETDSWVEVLRDSQSLIQLCREAHAGLSDSERGTRVAPAAPDQRAVY